MTCSTKMAVQYLNNSMIALATNLNNSMIALATRSKHFSIHVSSQATEEGNLSQNFIKQNDEKTTR